MPPLEHVDRYQKAVLWRKTGTDRHGQPIVQEVPDEINVRWNNKRREVMGPDGSPIAIDATVVLGPDEVVPIGSKMWLGRLRDMPGTALIPESDVMEVVVVDTTPDITNRNNRRQAMLQRHSDTLRP